MTDHYNWCLIRRRDNKVLEESNYDTEKEAVWRLHNLKVPKQYRVARVSIREVLRAPKNSKVAKAPEAEKPADT